MPSLFQTRNAAAIEKAARIAHRHRDRLRNPSLSILRSRKDRRDPGCHLASIRRAILTHLGPDFTCRIALRDAVEKVAPSACSYFRFQHVLEFLERHFRIECAKEGIPAGIRFDQFAVRLFPYTAEAVLALLDRMEHRATREDHPRQLAEEFSMTPCFVWRIWLNTRDPEDIPEIRSRLQRRFKI
jgi:hypothetical protein